MENKPVIINQLEQGSYLCSYKPYRTLIKEYEYIIYQRIAFREDASIYFNGERLGNVQNDSEGNLRVYQNHIFTMEGIIEKGKFSIIKKISEDFLTANI